jgi:hypothetical protein
MATQVQYVREREDTEGAPLWVVEARVAYNINTNKKAVFPVPARARAKDNFLATIRAREWGKAKFVATTRTRAKGSPREKGEAAAAKVAVRRRHTSTSMVAVAPKEALRARRQ